MNPPRVNDVTKPRSHKTTRTTAIVQSIQILPFSFSREFSLFDASDRSPGAYFSLCCLRGAHADDDFVGYDDGSGDFDDYKENSAAHVNFDQGQKIVSLAGFPLPSRSSTSSVRY